MNETAYHRALAKSDIFGLACFLPLFDLKRVSTKATDGNAEMPGLAFHHSAHYLCCDTILLRDHMSRAFMIELTYAHGVKVHGRDIDA